MLKVYTILFINCLVANISSAQYKYNDIIYDWKTVTEFTGQTGLPDPFLKPDGTRIKSINEWLEQRKYIIAMLEHYQYGTMPPCPENVNVKETLSEDLFNGIATGKLYTLTINRNGKTLDL